MRALSAILLAFTIFSGTTPASAEAPVQPPTPSPDSKKLAAAIPLSIAVKHCLVLEDSITQQYKLIDAFNTQPDLDNLPKDISDAEREKVMLYVMGRADIADFGFLIADLWKTTPRNLRIKWNALVTLRLDEILTFRANAYPFAGNCKGKLIGEITKTGNFSHARVELPLAFDQTEATLTYVLNQQDGYNWQIEDLLVNGVGVSNYLDKELNKNITSQGLSSELKTICKKSSFSNLKC